MSEHVSDEQLSGLIDGELSLAAREAVIAHVRACPGCAERHDALIDLTAVLRVQPAVQWPQSATEATAERLRGSPITGARRRVGGRDWTLALAGLLALAGGLAALLLAPVVSGGSIGALSNLLPGEGLVGSGHSLVALGAVAVAGLIALPLSRSR